MKLITALLTSILSFSAVAQDEIVAAGKDSSGSMVVLYDVKCNLPFKINGQFKKAEIYISKKVHIEGCWVISSNGMSPDVDLVYETTFINKKGIEVFNQSNMSIRSFKWY